MRGAAGAVSAGLLLLLIIGCERRPSAGPTMGHSPAARRSIVLICVDTLRADRVFGAGSPMPHLQSRMASGIRFLRAHASSPWTLPSVATVLTGRYPAFHLAGRRTTVGPADTQTDYSPRAVTGGFELVISGEIHRFESLHSEIPKIQDILGAAGYATAAIHSNGYLGPVSGLLAGMQFSRQYEPRSEVGTEIALEWLLEVEDPFFLFLHYIDPHQWIAELPPELKGKTFETLTEGDRAEILATYDDLVGRTDRSLERIFAQLDQRRERPIVVLLADHGERFFEEGVVGSHGGSHRESILNVPLIFWVPTFPPAEIDRATSLVDVAPTLLDLVGLPPLAGANGKSLVPLFAGDTMSAETLFSEYVLWPSEDSAAILADPWKLVVRGSHPGPLYRLDVDPAEQRDLSDRAPGIVRELHARLRAHRASGLRQVTGFASTDVVTFDEESLQSLRSLGYVD